MASQSSLTGGAGSQKQVSAVGKALLSMAKNLNEVSALLGGAETGIRSDLEIVVASRMVEYLAMDPTVDSRDTARELVSAFQRDARRMAHVSLVARADLPDQAGERGRRALDWYEASALGDPVQLLVQLEWSGTCWTASIKPIPTGRLFEQICMLRDLPDVHADGSGDFFEIRLLVCGHWSGAYCDWARAAESVEGPGGSYINELLETGNVLQIIDNHRQIYDAAERKFFGLWVGFVHCQNTFFTLGHDENQAHGGGSSLRSPMRSVRRQDARPLSSRAVHSRA
jgi:hypothetical protein